MAEEPIGKGCQCLYPFDKSVIIGALEIELKAHKDAFEHATKTPDAPLARFIVDMGPQAINIVETVLARVKAMPDCAQGGGF